LAARNKPVKNSLPNNLHDCAKNYLDVVAFILMALKSVQMTMEEKSYPKAELAIFVCFKT
jgi:hypothetical protein